jgi:hypothetical protein
MKRDAIPTPGLAAQPAPVAQRNTRAMLNTARTALLQREYGITELAEHIQAQHPDRTLNMVTLVERLVQLGEIELVDDKLGLTEAGEDVARRLGAHLVSPVGRPKPPPGGEAERRATLLAGNATSDPFALTRGLRRAASSAADLAPPPMRPGADTCLDLPSRIGDRLHYRDGRITSMDGSEIQRARTEQTYKPTRDGSSRATPAWSRDYL